MFVSFLISVLHFGYTEEVGGVGPVSLPQLGLFFGMLIARCGLHQILVRSNIQQANEVGPVSPIKNCSTALGCIVIDSENNYNLLKFFQKFNIIISVLHCREVCFNTLSFSILSNRLIGQSQKNVESVLVN